MTSFANYVRKQFNLPAFVQASLLSLLAFALTNFFLPVEEFEPKDVIFPLAVFAYVYVKNGTPMGDMPSDEKVDEQSREEEMRRGKVVKAPRIGARSVKYLKGMAPAKGTEVVVIMVWETWCKHCAAR